MKYWSIVITEESCSCGACGRVIEFGKPAFILFDTEEPIPVVKMVNCVDCMRLRYPEATEGL